MPFWTFVITAYLITHKSIRFLRGWGFLIKLKII